MEEVLFVVAVSRGTARWCGGAAVRRCGLPASGRAGQGRAGRARFRARSDAPEMFSENNSHQLDYFPLLTSEWCMSQVDGAPSPSLPSKNFSKDFSSLFSPLFCRHNFGNGIRANAKDFRYWRVTLCFLSFLLGRGVAWRGTIHLGYDRAVAMMTAVAARARAAPSWSSPLGLTQLGPPL